MKYLRIKKNTQFQKLFKKGKKVYSPYLSMIYFPSDKLSMGIAVSKKHGKAVTRNYIKRLVREAFSRHCGELEREYSVIVLPRIMEEYSFSAVESGILTCFKKVNECERKKS